MDDPRDPAFARNPLLEQVLSRMNTALPQAEAEMRAQMPAGRRPLLFVVGCPRSGSTLWMQWLARSGRFAYPTNFLSRFYAAPCVGASLQRVLFDPALQFREELQLAAPAVAFTSDLGKTSGALSPHEFWHFWRQHLHAPPGCAPTEAAEADFAAIDEALQGVASVFERPLAAKGHFLNGLLPEAAAALPDAYFVFLRRDPLYTAQSLWEARLRFFGTADAWYSLQIPEYERLRRLRPEEQVAGQVFYTERVIEAGLAHVPAGRHLTLSYEAFCAAPDQAGQQVAALLAAHPAGQDLRPGSTAPFASANARRLPGPVLDRIAAAYRAFASG